MNHALLISCVLALTSLGCSTSQPTSVLPPRDLPDDETTIHPWIAQLLDRDVAGVTQALDRRFAHELTEDLAPMVALIRSFVPRRIEFSDTTGYVLCVKSASGGGSDTAVNNHLYIAQPLPQEVVAERVQYFDESVRSMMHEFVSKFAGCGEKMEGHAGQFALFHDAAAEDVAYYAPETLGDWADARLLYSASNGDSVFVNRAGGTAWHVMETNEIVLLFDRFPDFVKHYAGLRAISGEFDSWVSRDFLAKSP